MAKEKSITNKNFFELTAGDVYCLEYIESIIKDSQSNNYDMYYKDNMKIVLNKNEYEFIRNLIKKFANSYNIY